MRCYRRLLNISYKDHVTNEGVRRMVQAVIGECDELLTLVKKNRKLGWFGHVSRFSGPTGHSERKKKLETDDSVGRQY